VEQLSRWFPVVGQVRSVGVGGLRRELQAGVVLCAVVVPTGLGYAAAAGLAPVVGLYASIVPLVVYGLIGLSPVLVVGPDSSLVALIAAVVIPAAHGDARRAVALASWLALLAGLLCVLAAVARFGFLAELISAPVRYGYLGAIALTIVVSQVPATLGLADRPESMLGALRTVARGWSHQQLHGPAVALAGGALVLAVALRRLDRRLPALGVVVVAAIAITAATHLTRHGVAVIGALPRGLPLPRWPGVGAHDLPALFGAAVAAAFIVFADTAVLTRTYAARRGDTADVDRELLALGAANVVCGLLQGFPASCSQSRTPVADEAGARTQLSGLVAAAVIATMMLAAPRLVSDLPQAVLAAIVIVAAWRLVEVRALARLWRTRRGEWFQAVAAFLAVALLGPLVGIGVAVGVSLLAFMRKVWRPYATELVRVDGLKGYHDVLRHPEGHRVPGLVLYRFDAPLFFANAGWFAADLSRRVEATPGVSRVVVTGEPITDVDATAADELALLAERLQRRGVELAFAELKGTVRDRLEPFGLVERLGRDRFYRTTGEAVHAYVRDHEVDWHDWEDDDSGGTATPTS
jgi:high affinity sulfate transporter 1